MKVILFTGHHKVGSTSLQKFLLHNRMALLEQGILYPSTAPAGLAQDLQAALAWNRPGQRLMRGLGLRGAGLQAARALGRARWPANVAEPHNALAFKLLSEGTRSWKLPEYHRGLPHSRQMLQTVAAQVATLQPQAVILASEVFANMGLGQQQMIRRIADLFPGAEVRIITVFRQIDSYLAAWHMQRLRFGARLAPLAEGGLQDYWDTVHFDYRQALAGWRAVLPEAELVLRPYEEVKAAGGSVADFMAVSGLRFPRGLIRRFQANASLHPALAELARRGNLALAPEPAAALRQFLQRSAAARGLPSAADVEVYGAGLRRELLERFHPVHAALGQLSGRHPFFVGLEAAAAVRPHPLPEVAAAALAQLQRDLSGLPDAAARQFLQQLQLPAAAK
ncbi:hypothetical protein AB838_21750 [Rhodobacteraceae bacterium (ex Bugula neritina AB1)]|nr:hypothetical protein AB838_21750 [Rhodobacteraceae bacterium (ex Bugula neritina AB1)]